MSRTTRRPRKHVPQRTCIGCRTVQEKRRLIRVVRTPEGVFVDPSGKQNGRGAYLHEIRSCWDRGLRGGLAKALKVSLQPADIERLSGFAEGLPQEDLVSGQPSERDAETLNKR